MTVARLANRFPPASQFKCVDCGDDAYVYDHRDYEKPMQFEPVCYPCNKRRGNAHVDRLRFLFW